MRRLVSLIALLLAFPAPADAQQTTASLGLGSVPAGITVMVTGSVPVDKWLEAVSYGAKSAAQAEQFATALRGAGVPAAAISVQPTVVFATTGTSVSVTFMPSLASRIAQLARARGLTQTQVQMVPADSQELYERAVTLAIQGGRKTASAVAAADHQHIGRLLNFVPSPVEMAKQLASNTLTGVFLAPATDGAVSAYGIATFELTP